MVQIHIVGTGLNGQAGLPPPTLKLIYQAQLLLGSTRHLSYFPDHPAQKLVIDKIEEAIELLESHIFGEFENAPRSEPPILNPFAEVSPNPELRSRSVSTRETSNSELRSRSVSEGETPNSELRIPNSEFPIVLLTSGDPLFFGLGRLLLERLPKDCLTFHPHVSSMQLAFSRIKMPWQDAQWVSVHGRSLDNLISLVQQGTEKLAILTDPQHNPATIAQLLLSLDLPHHYQCWVCENLGGDNEQIHEGSPEQLRDKCFASLSVMVLQRISSNPKPCSRSVSELRTPFAQRLRTPNSELRTPNSELRTPNSVRVASPLEKLRTPNSELRTPNSEFPIIGIPDTLFASFNDRPGLMTKREVRILILGELALHPSQVVWDIGAGTGSVSIEIARLCPSSQIYAIEKTAAGQTLIEQNCRRFQVENVTRVQGEAPCCLKDLPDPDRIFIGGSGGHLLEMLDYCGERLVAGSSLGQKRLVLALATVEHLAIAQTWVQTNQWCSQLRQVQLSRSATVGNLTRYVPLNPVTLMTIEPPP
jgi:precorrin-6Y C5,15-methyltransferase (decarboxylating)